VRPVSPARDYTPLVLGRVRLVAFTTFAVWVGVAAPAPWASHDATPLRGTLRATTDTLGRVTLRLGGKPVRSLRAGSFRIVVVDRTNHSGFILDRPDLTQIIVTSSPFVGTRTVTVTLTPGTWSYQGAVGALHDFTVVV
jgi:hypothetical protein